MPVESADLPITTRSHYPDNQGGSERKRRRKVLSCYDCRRRKLQCDRAMPACSRCKKAGQAANCLYLEDTDEMPSRESDSTDRLTADRSHSAVAHLARPNTNSRASGNVLVGRLEFQDQRIRELEGAIAQQNAAALHMLKINKFSLTSDSVGGGAEQTASTGHDRETVMMRGMSFKTQFNGATHTAALLGQLPELNVFTKDVFNRFPALSRIRQNMKQLENRTLYAGSEKQMTTDEGLRALLPPKEEADALIEHYLEYFDNIYHVIHVPTFRRQYEEMWRDVPNAHPHFVAVSLLMTACGRCLMPDQPWLYTANSSTAREQAVTAIQACDDWIQRQSQKHVKIENFQIRFLLVVSKVINARKFKRSWTETGTCLRFFMGAGLHRNPELLRKRTTALDKELRRRLWNAAAEFELQVSFDRGMVAMPWPMQSDCPPPSKIHDEDMDQSTDGLVSIPPATEFTRSSYLALANGTLLLRHRINTLLNNIHQPISFDEVKRLTEEIEIHLRNEPDWIGASAEAPKALLTINLRQYLLALHDRLMRQSTSPFERNFSRTILFDTATTMIDAHRRVVNKGNFALILLCQDFLRVALAMCHLYTNVDPAADGTIIHGLVESAAFHVVEEANELIADKVVRYGREQRQQWIALVAYGFMKATRDPSCRLACMQEVVDKITRPYYRILASQEGAAAAAAMTTPLKIGAEAQDEEMPNGVLEYLPDVAGQPATNDADNIDDPTLLDFGDMDAWVFDDFAFTTGDFDLAADPSQIAIQQLGSGCEQNVGII